MGGVSECASERVSESSDVSAHLMRVLGEVRGVTAVVGTRRVLTRACCALLQFTRHLTMHYTLHAGRLMLLAAS